MTEGNVELIEYLDGKFKKVEDDFIDLKKDFNLFQTSVDAYAKKADTYFQEMAMLTHKVNRLEKWLEKVAEKLDMKLDY